MIDLNDELVHFVIGSSFFITIFPLAYLLYAHSNLTEEEKLKVRVSLHTLVIVLPFLFGFFMAIIYRCISFVPRKYGDTIYLRFIVAGSISSLFISIFCHYVCHIQDEWMHMENPNACHVIAPLFYFAVFYTIGLWLRAQLLYGSSNPHSSSSSSFSPPPMPPTNSTKFSPSVGSSSASASTYNQLAAKAKSMSSDS